MNCEIDVTLYYKRELIQLMRKGPHDKSDLFINAEFLAQLDKARKRHGGRRVTRPLEQLADCNEYRVAFDHDAGAKAVDHAEEVRSILEHCSDDEFDEEFFLYGPFCWENAEDLMSRLKTVLRNSRSQPPDEKVLADLAYEIVIHYRSRVGYESEPQSLAPIKKSDLKDNQASVGQTGDETVHLKKELRHLDAERSFYVEEYARLRAWVIQLYLYEGAPLLPFFEGHHPECWGRDWARF